MKQEEILLAAIKKANYFKLKNKNIIVKSFSDPFSFNDIITVELREGSYYRVYALEEILFNIDFWKALRATDWECHIKAISVLSYSGKIDYLDELLTNKTMKFKVGDRVRIKDDCIVSYINGVTGVIESIYDGLASVRGVNFKLENLEPIKEVTKEEALELLDLLSSPTRIVSEEWKNEEWKEKIKQYILNN